MCATSAAAAVRRKYGKYLPHQRANVDQVPLPLVNDMESTYQQVGEKRVWPSTRTAPRCRSGSQLATGGVK